MWPAHTGTHMHEYICSILIHTAVYVYVHISIHTHIHTYRHMLSHRCWRYLMTEILVLPPFYSWGKQSKKIEWKRWSLSLYLASTTNLLQTWSLWPKISLFLPFSAYWVKIYARSLIKSHIYVNYLGSKEVQYKKIFNRKGFRIRLSWF